MPTDADCVFCKIVSGQIPNHTLCEDDHILAFLDIGPLSDGHCLIIPKAHYVTLDELPEETAAACARVLPRLSRAVMRATGATAWNVLQNNGAIAGQAVDHVHFHIIPRKEGDSLGYRWNAKTLDGDRAKQLRQAIQEALGG